MPHCARVSSIFPIDSENVKLRRTFLTDSDPARSTRLRTDATVGPPSFRLSKVRRKMVWLRLERWFILAATKASRESIYVLNARGPDSTK